MPSFNKTQQMGNLTRDPELRYTSTGASVCNFGLAVNEKFQKDSVWKTKAHFFDVQVWGGQAEACAEFLKKGSLVFVDGKLDYQTWETDKGEKRHKIAITALSVQFLDKKKDTDVPL